MFNNYLYTSCFSAYDGQHTCITYEAINQAYIDARNRIRKFLNISLPILTFCFLQGGYDWTLGKQVYLLTIPTLFLPWYMSTSYWGLSEGF